MEENPDGGYYANPKTDCPHIHPYLTDEECLMNFVRRLLSLQDESKQGSCSSCFESTENWICFDCGQCFCSRYRNGHMAEHFAEAKSVSTAATTESATIPESAMVVVESPGDISVRHACAMSLTDGSFWCFECEDYIFSNALRALSQASQILKFENLATHASAFAEAISTAQTLAGASSEKGPFTAEMLIDGMKERKYSKYCEKSRSTALQCMDALITICPQNFVMGM
jgi:hypothetical protein